MQYNLYSLYKSTLTSLKNTCTVTGYQHTCKVPRSAAMPVSGPSEACCTKMVWVVFSNWTLKCFSPLSCASWTSWKSVCWWRWSGEGKVRPFCCCTLNLNTNRCIYYTWVWYKEVREITNQKSQAFHQCFALTKPYNPFYHLIWSKCWCYNMDAI